MEEASYYRVAVLKHPDIKDEWVASVLANPYHVEAQTDGRLRCYGYVEEAGKWLRVVVEDGKFVQSVLRPRQDEGMGQAMSIDVQYLADSDTLSLWTGVSAAEAEEVAEGVIVDFDSDGNVVGFTLERAAALLQPMLDTARTARVSGAGVQDNWPL